MRERRSTGRDIQTYPLGPVNEKRRAEQHCSPIERRKKKEVRRESERGQRKREQVMVLSCWCHKGSSCHLAVIGIAHNIPFIHNISSPYFASSASLVKQLPVWCTFSLPITQLPMILYISFSFLLAVSGWKLYLSYTCSLLSHTHTLPLSYCIPHQIMLFFSPHTLGLCFLTCTLPWDLLI